MKYVSTRGKAPELNFDEVLLTGLARDGGLYVPAAWPKLTEDDLREMRGLSYEEIAARVMYPFVEGCIPEDDFAHLVADAYAGFDHDATCPLKQLDSNTWVMELFHGPTLAFKDVALQLLGRLFDYVLKKQGKRVTIAGATSGDTGSAAIEACRDREAIDIFILHPHNRTSEVQRRQMTSVLSMNVHNVAVEGTFDDCQDLVKAMFNDLSFRDEVNLSAVNSINWARIMAQIVYYVYAGVSLGAPERGITVSVPTGNFGNIFAAYAAREMGLPIDQFIVGSNSNDILTRFLSDNDMSMKQVSPSLSPSMDIQVSSNFERLLFDLLDRDGEEVEETMQQFRASGKMPMEEDRWRRAAKDFTGHCLDDNETLAAIGAIHESSGELVDPHTAVGIIAGWTQRKDPASPLVCMATAHPAKFPDAVEEATGIRPALPNKLADLFDREERFEVLPNSVDAIQTRIRKSNSAGSAE
ncbi:threonine synthase [Aestuariispira insulae]|uniref:Threonine synthase n=1 Tax=Aestuariispira insulae TaxID=1461337 RepID=A0A3D9HGM4_9PROT|nr:threonine synthase [Aestuariispira insulae]RED48639.1 threonine synthase [Aestuariispira insulae]